ncbi:hypothetical protein FGIG_03394 [Fasciola gigantica]|uniref:Uncharacterized protein n=1 Tax=Fasciola gigantica TaxID=46835 RepID=A0A504YFP5_FASGI|nr:hypothetical protein FGIG_03394 [Fasciola gigantica]
MITNKASSAEKIRWNANFAVGHLFQNTNLWLWLSDQWNRDVQNEPRDFAAVDPLASVETVQLIKKLIRYLCQTFGGDKYFKTRVYAANSLLGLFVHKQHALTGSPLHIMRQSLTRIASEPIDCCLEFNVLDAAFRIIGQVHNGNASVPCCAEYLQRTISHVNFHSSGTHLSERKYRQQCLHMAILLIFYSLASWLYTADRDSLDSLETNLTSEWLCPIVLSHIAGSLRDCAASRDCPDLTECKLETIYPRPMILSHLLDLTDTTSPTERLTQAVQLFQSRVASLPCAVGPGMQQLITLVQTVEVMPKEIMLCIGTTWCSLNELQKPTTPETILSDVSRFRQVYD